MPTTLLDRIAIDPAVMTGLPVIRGTRIPVEMVVRLVAQGIAFQDILTDYPRLVREDVQAALWYAAAAIVHEDVYPLSWKC